MKKVNRILNKRGDITSDNVVTTIIAVVGIVLLMIAVGAVGYRLLALGETQAEQNAKNTITMLQAKSNILASGQSAKTLLREIQGSWYIIGWSKNDDNRPPKCYFNSCICICDAPTKDSCQSAKGFCRKVNAKEVSIKGSNIKSKSGYTLGGSAAASAATASSSSETISPKYITLGSSQLNLGLIQLRMKLTGDTLSITNFDTDNPYGQVPRDPLASYDVNKDGLPNGKIRYEVRYDDVRFGASNNFISFPSKDLTIGTKKVNYDSLQKSFSSYFFVRSPPNDEQWIDLDEATMREIRDWYGDGRRGSIPTLSGRIKIWDKTESLPWAIRGSSSSELALRTEMERDRLVQPGVVVVGLFSKMDRNSKTITPDFSPYYGKILLEMSDRVTLVKADANFKKDEYWTCSNGLECGLRAGYLITPNSQIYNTLGKAAIDYRKSITKIPISIQYSDSTTNTPKTDSFCVILEQVVDPQDNPTDVVQAEERKDKIYLTIDLNNPQTTC